MRIKVPQPLDRPLTYRRKDVLRREYIRNSPWGFILHRKGVSRPFVGEDPLEQRAVPVGYILGTLPERIVYKYLVEQLHFVSGLDFDFQSSLQGGRLQLGGILVDFLFEMLMVILQVDGPTHRQFLRARKDEEQRDILASMGYTVYALTDTEIYNMPVFEEKMRRIFSFGFGRLANSFETENDSAETIVTGDWDTALAQTIALEAQI